MIEMVDDCSRVILLPEIEVNTWWTNLTCAAETVIDLYHAHGTSEQFHRELKSDLDVERLCKSCGRITRGSIVGTPRNDEIID